MKIVRRLVLRGPTPPADAGGIASVRFPAKGDDGQFLVIERITTVVTGQAGQAHFGLYENDEVNYENRLEFTTEANFGIADESSPIYVDAAAPLIVVFDSLDVGNRGHFRLQCRIEDPHEQPAGSGGEVGAGASQARSGQGWG